MGGCYLISKDAVKRATKVQKVIVRAIAKKDVLVAGCRGIADERAAVAATAGTVRELWLLAPTPSSCELTLHQHLDVALSLTYGPTLSDDTTAMAGR